MMIVFSSRSPRPVNTLQIRFIPASRLGEHIGEELVAFGLVLEQPIHCKITGEPMKFLTLADWTGMVETELFAQTYGSYGPATVRYPVLEITAKVEPFENGHGFSLRAPRAGKPRSIVGKKPAHNVRAAALLVNITAFRAFVVHHGGHRQRPRNFGMIGSINRSLGEKALVRTGINTHLSNILSNSTRIFELANNHARIFGRLCFPLRSLALS